MKPRKPLLIAGAGIVAGSVGHQYEARPHAELPEKAPGRHRWVATAAWVVSQDLVNRVNSDGPKYLDNENLLDLSLGCWDCERPLGSITPDSACPASGADG